MCVVYVCGGGGGSVEEMGGSVCCGSRSPVLGRFGFAERDKTDNLKQSVIYIET